MEKIKSRGRLSNFLSYEWIIMLFVAAACILGWELIYSVSAVKLTSGQEFEYFYDEQMYSGSDEAFRDYLKDTFSFDVLNVVSETLTGKSSSSYDLLSVRLSGHEGDAIVTNDRKKDTATDYKGSRANIIVDVHDVYDMEKLYDDAVNYLSGFLKDGKEISYDGERKVAPDYSDLDEAKIKNNFEKRLSSDNRYKRGLISVSDEYDRINKLTVETKDFLKILKYDDALTEENTVFYRYRKYEQAYNTAISDAEKNYYKELYDRETVKAYGIRTDKLPVAEGKEESKKFFKIAGELDGADTVVMFFDFLEYQPDLQFETVSFLNTVVRSFSSILD